ncbi:MAG TPA: MlaD family protein [Geothrix sp.]|nr:MlaD family protein [Geothrix sp.]
MVDSQDEPIPVEPPPAKWVKRRRRPQVVWIIPLVALLIGLWLAFKAYRETGPTITITFQSGEGIEADHTKIKYKDVEVGKVKAVDLTSDRSRVLVTAELKRDAEALLSRNSQFWVVRARISATGVSGLGTLLSGAYIAVEPGEPGPFARDFQGQETPPFVKSKGAGEQFLLRADKLGSINIGSPVYFRQIKVGEVAGFDLDQDGQSVGIQIFVHAPYHKLVRQDTRFWNAGGVDVTVDANGVHMSSDSLVDMLMGGIAFENPASLESSQGVPPEHAFVLYPSHERIYEKVYLNRHSYVLYFQDSVRGLSRGAPVEFHGMKVGQVEDLKLEFNTQKLQGEIPVLISLEPERMSLVGGAPMSMDALLQKLVGRGLRAQLKLGSLITGSQFVDLEFHPEAPSRSITSHGKFREIPTIPTTMGTLISNLTNFLSRLQALPLEDVARDLKAAMPALRETLEHSQALMTRLNRSTAPQAEATLAQAQATLAAVERSLRADAPLQNDLRTALQDFSQAARALKELAETLERQPESMIYGKRKKP